MDDNLAAINNRINDLRYEVTQQFNTLKWLIFGWFGILTILIIIFRFVRPPTSEKVSKRTASPRKENDG